MKTLSPQEIEHYRRLFPVCENWIYLNHAGVAPISRRVAEAGEAFDREALHHGYTAGPHWSKRFQEIRRRSAELLGANPEEVAFVRNTSHGLSLVARGLGLQEGDEIILGEGEFPSNVYPWLALKKRGVILKEIPLRENELDLDQLEHLITPRTRVISLSSVQYGNGYRLPIEEVGRLCRDLGIYFCLDAIQSLGAFPLDVHRECVDFAAADAHKWILGHEGIGVFYLRKEIIEQVEPALLGWNSVQGALEFDRIEFRLRSTAERFEEGSPNGVSIYGLGAAVELLLEVGIERIAARILTLTERLIAGLHALELNVTNSLQPRHRSGIVTCRIPGDRELEKLARLERHLFAEKIYVSIRRGNLRFSPHFYNTEEEIDRTLAEIRRFCKGNL